MVETTTTTMVETTTTMVGIQKLPPDLPVRSPPLQLMAEMEGILGTAETVAPGQQEEQQQQQPPEPLRLSVQRHPARLQPQRQRQGPRQRARRTLQQ